MRLSRFFTDTPLSLGEHELPEAQAHYISRVLRMTEGDALQLFDGSGSEFRGTLLEVGKKRVRVRTLARSVAQAYLQARAKLGFPMAPPDPRDEVLAKLEAAQ